MRKRTRSLRIAGTGLLVIGMAFWAGGDYPHAAGWQEPVTGRIADFRELDSQPLAASTTGLPWYLERVRADDAWSATAAGTDIIVAVLDTGIDEKHEDLVGKVIARVNFGPSPTTSDVHGHGTAIAGVITASMENLRGATGIAYGSALLNVKVTGDDGFVTADAVAKGIVWAVEHGARVINLSLTLSNPSPAVEEAVRYAWENGAVIVAAAGNTANSKPVYPAASPYVIGVGATDKDDRAARWSGRGDWVSVAAPGTDIYSTLPADKYALKSGTSFSAALVSGEAALLFAIARDVNGDGAINDEVRDAIIAGIEASGDGRVAGRIDVLAAVKRLTR